MNQKLDRLSKIWPNERTFIVQNCHCNLTVVKTVSASEYTWVDHVYSVYTHIYSSGTEYIYTLEQLLRQTRK